MHNEIYGQKEQSNEMKLPLTESVQMQVLKAYE
jgi:hypothetical protein